MCSGIIVVEIYTNYYRVKYCFNCGPATAYRLSGANFTWKIYILLQVFKSLACVTLIGKTEDEIRFAIF